MSLFLVLLCFIPAGLSAQVFEKGTAGFDPKTDLISEKYDAGPYLIYDCEEGHWVCVMEEFYKECEDKRAEDKVQKRFSSRCAAIGKLPTKRSCFQRQLYMVSNDHGASFCLLNQWQEKEIDI